jgi:Nucleotidyltransferase domain
MDVIQLNRNLQNEAKELLVKTNLLAMLEKFGKIELGGSYVYGTMVDRDIDIAVVVGKERLGLELRKIFMDMLLDIKELDGLEMTDRVQNPKGTSPYGIWFGPKINYNGNKWNIDIWLVSPDEPLSHHNHELHKKMLKINDEQRKIILDIKYKTLVAGLKKKGTSANIYIEVLNNTIKSYEEFIEST